jgi:hypothetical protein
MDNTTRLQPKVTDEGRRHVRASIRVACVALACALAASGASASAVEPQTSSQTLLIRAAYNVAPALNLGCGGLRARGTGTAIGSPVGPSTWSDNECASLIAQLGKVVINGAVVITGAHGTLNISYSAKAPLPITLTIHPAGTFTITGGTGEFAGATGHGTVVASGSLLPPGPAVAQLDGVIYLSGAA